jgi:hypothetical protein
VQVTRNRPGSGQGEGEEGRHKRRPRIAHFIVICATLAFPMLIFSGCGLETVAYYSPPYFLNAGQVITLTHNPQNSDSNFLGYDIYYRAYYSASDADTARNAIENTTNSTSSTPESVLLQMTNTGFKKIYAYLTPQTPPTPLFAVSSATTFNIQMSRSSSANWYYNTDTPQTEIVRGIGLAANNSFNYQYLDGDVDYGSKGYSVQSGGTVYFVFFAVAYGYDFSRLSAIYSFPQSLYSSIQYGPLP